jgi:large subunit ribosomal protein L30
LTLNMAFVVLRIKGSVNVPYWARYTLDSLNLYRKFWATILPETQESLGMLKKVKDFVAWTNVDASLVKDLLEKRGKAGGSKSFKLLPDVSDYHSVEELASDIAKDRVRLSNLQMVKPWFALSPPRGGFKKSTKRSYNQSGILGEDKELVQLIRRMI